MVIEIKEFVQKQNTINLIIKFVTPGQSKQPKKSINHQLGYQSGDAVKK
jgi:hypothetical protein